MSTDHTIEASFTSAPVPPTPVPTPRPPTPVSGGGSGDGYSSTVSSTVNSIGAASFSAATGITGISFAKGTTGSVILDTKPSGTTAPANSYAVYGITGPSFEGYAQIEFRVPVSVITDNGYTVNDVIIQHSTGGKWVKLQTTYIGEERGAACYVSLTNSLSPAPFAITYEKGGAKTIERATPEPTAAEPSSSTTAAPTAASTGKATSQVPATGTTVPAAAATTGAQPTLTQAPAPVAGALLGLLAAGILLRRRD